MAHGMTVCTVSGRPWSGDGKLNGLRRAHLVKNILRANFGGGGRPYKLTFAVTNRCNARCRICRIWQKPVGPELTLAEIVTLFRKNPFFSWIDLTGGEPFLRPDIVPLTAAVLAQSPRLYHLHFPTNGIAPALTIARIEEILALNPPRLTLTLSLDGPPELHDTLRGVAGNWENCLAIHRHFADHPHPRLQLFFGFTCSDLNVGALSAAMRAVEVAAPGAVWHLNLAHNARYYGNDSLPVRSAAHRDAFRAEIAALRATKKGWLDPVAFLERRYLTHADRFMETGTTPLPCLAGRSSLFLAADGECFPCSSWDRSLGNLREFDLDLAALLARNGAVLREIRAEKCVHCWTPCDAYPTILGNLFRLPARKKW